jgi:hypothetical protein
MVEGGTWCTHGDIVGVEADVASDDTALGDEGGDSGGGIWGVIDDGEITLGSPVCCLTISVSCRS